MSQSSIESKERLFVRIWFIMGCIMGCILGAWLFDGVDCCFTLFIFGIILSFFGSGGGGGGGGGGSGSSNKRNKPLKKAKRDDDDDDDDYYDYDKPDPTKPHIGPNTKWSGNTRVDEFGQIE